ncbi:hypothetical protein SCACP_39140 [Sporomusa carbonis]|uniref:hypothetical protein n=1 Tax=Sporomusa carbonis TaxID=3076075 RepID=UPI003A73869D
MLQYTGHPFYDIGVATICALAKKFKPTELTQEDLERAATFIEENYGRDPLKSFLGVAFTTNAWFNQPAFDKQPEKRREYANRILRSFSTSDNTSEQRCVFTGEPVTTAAFSDKLPPGRAFRQHIPLLTGEGVINFHPWGDAGLPVSGKAALCLQAFPLGCAKCGGRLLAVHSDNPDITFRFAAEFLQYNREVMLLAQESGSKKMPEAKMSARTLLIDTFLRIEKYRQAELEETGFVSVTAYHLTNSGQSNALDEQNPPLSIYYLPLELTDFFKQIFINSTYKIKWQEIVNRAWQHSGGVALKKKSKGVNEDKPLRNFLYEDLFKLPNGVLAFIRRYFLRVPSSKGSDEDPRLAYSLEQEYNLVSWEITKLFLRKVMKMNSERIEKIALLGERLAEYIRQENDKKFFTDFYRVNKYEYLRNILIKANMRNVKQGNSLILDFDLYLSVFEEAEEFAYSDWRLARDLVLIKVVEKLYELEWFSKNSDVFTNLESEEDKEE